MLRQCFEMGTPLRAANENRHVLWGNVFAIALHLPLLFILSRMVGIVGAALAWLVSDLTISIYLARRIMLKYDLRMRELLVWKDVSKLVAAALAAAPILLIASFGPLRNPWTILASCVLYGLVFFLLVRRLRIAEIDRLLAKIAELLAARMHRIRR